MKYLKIFPVIISFIFVSGSTTSANSGAKLPIKKADTRCCVNCLFGSCCCHASGAGAGCVCSCIWGFPICGAGGGGKGTATEWQLLNIADFVKVVNTFESAPGSQLQKNLAKYTEIIRAEEDPYDIVQEIKGNIERLPSEEQDQVTEFLLSRGGEIEQSK